MLAMKTESMYGKILYPSKILAITYIIIAYKIIALLDLIFLEKNLSIKIEKGLILFLYLYSIL